MKKSLNIIMWSILSLVCLGILGFLLFGWFGVSVLYSGIGFIVSTFNVAWRIF